MSNAEKEIIMNNGIILLGLGPGDMDQLTIEAWDVLQSCGEVFLRTKEHPMVAELPKVTVKSFDYLYESIESFEAVYDAIVEEVLRLGQREGGVVYAVPGHPFVAESTGPEIAKRAKALDLPVRVVAGLSFLEGLFAAVGEDPFPQTALVDAFDLAQGHHVPFSPDKPAVVAQIHSRGMASEVKLTLMSVYPDEHDVILVHGAGTKQEIVEHIPLYAIDRSEHTGLLTSLYVPPLPGYTSMEALLEIVAHLRAPEGCPWDQEQTLESLRSSLVEEAYEVVEAIDLDQPEKVAEEIGDLIMVAMMMAQIGSDEGLFTITDAVRSICEKLIRRHPHVFGDVKVESTEELLRTWEAIKANERMDNGESEKGLLDGVPQSLPALLQSREYHERAARVGFDWPDVEGVLDKVMEEVGEIQEAETDQAREAEIGDLFFILVKLASWHGVDAETALRATNAKFKSRFKYIERKVRGQGKKMQDYDLESLDKFWAEAKSRVD